jgi:hypothetical protein
MDKDKRSGGQQQQQDTESGHGKQGFASMPKGNANLVVICRH